MKLKKNVLATANLAVVAKEFTYKLIRSKRRTLSIEINSGKVIVRSPLLLPEKYIYKFLREKNNWILNKINSFKASQRSGILFLGAEYEVEYGGRFEVSDKIYLRVLGYTKIEEKKALEKFFHKETSKRVENFLDKYNSYFDYKTVKYKKYSSKWGSCSPTNDLNFNIYLSMCPEDVIEYVVVHELCHTLVKNHSRDFYTTVEKYMPNYKNSIKWLRRNRGLI